jgi:MarR family transcriptional regulator, lower aerobic nicotinate degradation pathway regulator
MRVLEARALVDRAPSVVNRRNLHLTLSSDGAAVLAQARLGADRAYKKFMAPLSATQQTELVGLLKGLATGLEGHARAPFVPLLNSATP